MTNIIGFHQLAEDGVGSCTPLERTLWDAHVYAGGVELAHEVMKIAKALGCK